MQLLRHVVALGSFILVVTVATSDSACAQANKPRLMLNTGGSVGGVRSVHFSPDSSRLYAAGSGKVVNVWELHRDDGNLRAIPAEPLRWEVARGMRGRIYTIDVASTGEVAVAGLSAREASGDVAVFDPKQRSLLYLLPNQRPDVPGPGPRPGHVQTVGSVDFSPSGRQVVTMSLDGEVRLWRDRGAGSAILQPAGQVTNGFIHKAAFLDEQRLVFPQPDPAQQGIWRLVVVDLSAPNPQPRVLSQPVLNHGLAAIAVSRDGQHVAVSDHIGEITLLRNDGTLQPQPLNRVPPQPAGPAIKTVTSMSFGPAGRLAVTTSADESQQCWLEIWQTGLGEHRMMTAEPLGKGQAAFATAISPDGTLLAATRADRPTIRLIPMNAVGLPGPPMDLARSFELGGRGRLPENVAFVSNQGYRIAFKSRTANEDVQFDLTELRRLPGDIPPESRPEAAAGWRLETKPIAVNGNQELLLYPGNSQLPQCSIVLNTSQQGGYLTHTFLTDEQGQTYGVAIATQRMDGIFLYELSKAGQCRLMRYLSDHNDAINGLSVSHDGRYLASSSDDQTVKIWSLAGLRGVNQTFPREDAWGATFAIESGRVVVKTALGAGIAVHRDLQPGDVITRAIFAGPQGPVPVNDPRAILQGLTNTPLWQTLRLSTVRNGQPRAEDIIVTPAWEPLATLFFDHNNEWAMWTPQGVYDASAGGDELFGWHINVGRTENPQYFRAEKFRRELEKPDVMRQLLTAGSLIDAQLALNAAQARPVSDIAAELPQIEIISPQPGDHVPQGQTATVQAVVTYPPGVPPNNFRPRLFINQIDGGEPQAQLNGNTITYSWTASPVAEQNRLLVRIEESSGRFDGLFQDAVIHITADRPASRMKMHVFALSAENYGGLLHQPFCNDDAVGLAELLKSHTGRQYEVGEIEVLTDEEAIKTVSKTAVKEKIAGFQQRLAGLVQPDDLLVVFVAGHGRAYGSDYFFIPPDDKLGNAPGEEVIRNVGISWNDLRALAETPCRKVYLLDTCHSGNVAQAEKSSLRPLRNMQAMIFAATSENQEALGQHPDRDNGLFTGYLIDGCNGKADGVEAYDPVNPKFAASRDGRINLLEVVSYVSHNVRGFNRFQRPKYTPVELLNFVDLPLFAVGIDGTGS